MLFRKTKMKGFAALTFVLLVSISILLPKIVNAGGDSFFFQFEQQFDEPLLTVEPLIPDCKLGRFGVPTMELTDDCNAGRCRMTKISFKRKLNGIRQCCCTKWPKVEE